MHDTDFGAAAADIDVDGGAIGDEGTFDLVGIDDLSFATAIDDLELDSGSIEDFVGNFLTVYGFAHC